MGVINCVGGMRGNIKGTLREGDIERMETMKTTLGNSQRKSSKDVVETQANFLAIKCDSRRPGPAEFLALSWKSRKGGWAQPNLSGDLHLLSLVGLRGCVRAAHTQGPGWLLASSSTR